MGKLGHLRSLAGIDGTVSLRCIYNSGLDTYAETESLSSSLCTIPPLHFVNQCHFLQLH